MAKTTQVMKDKVKERYGAIADRLDESATPAVVELETTAADSCCGPVGGSSTETQGEFIQVADGGSCCSSTEASITNLAEALYNQNDIADLPDTVTSISLGCGNPTAIANLKPGETVLDLGSGGGIDCFLAAKAVGPTGFVIGVDMTDSMLNVANQNKAKMGITNVEFRQGEIEDLPVESDSIDVIISNCVINLSPDKDAVFHEAFRVLKPGGRFTVSDMVTEGQFPEQLRQNVKAWAGCITGAIDQADYLDKLRAVGFTNVEVESRQSYGIENIDLLDADSREALTKNVDWDTVPDDVRLFSARIIARKEI